MKKKNKVRGKNWSAVILSILIVSGLIIICRYTGWLQFTEWGALDFLFQIKSTQPHDERIVIVAQTETDMSKYGWPISDKNLAKLINQIKKQRT